MKTKWFLPLLALILATVACTWTDIAPPSAPVIEPSPLPTFAISTLTPVPTETSLPTPTSTPDAPIAWPKDLGVNCRYGPGIEWEVVSTLLAGTTTEIKGRTVNTSWWYVSDPVNLDSFCWVAYDVVDTGGNLNIIPIVEAPIASVTNVTVDVLVAFITCGGDNPVNFNGAITTNGPTTVTYYWEVGGDAQTTTADTTLQLDESGTKKVASDFFSTDCGSYFVKLVVSSPNEISAEKAFKVQSP